MLEELLARLAALTPVAQARWEAEVREELDEDEDWEPDGEVWLTLEHDSNRVWLCGFRVQPDEASEWGVHVAGSTPLEAAQALLAKLS